VAIKCPRCGGKSYKHDEELIDSFKKATHIIYYCVSCNLYWRKPRGGPKVRKYINLNDNENVLDVVEMFK